MAIAAALSDAGTVIMVDIVLTDQRIIYKTGLLSIDVFELQLAKVESARLVQAWRQRLIDAGTLVVSGTGGHAKPIIRLAMPREFRGAIYDLIGAGH